MNAKATAETIFPTIDFGLDLLTAHAHSSVISTHLVIDTAGHKSIRVHQQVQQTYGSKFETPGRKYENRDEKR